MAECANCGAHLTARNVRVAVPDDERPVEACPHCPDRTRADGRPRESRSVAGREARRIEAAKREGEQS